VLYLQVDYLHHRITEYVYLPEQRTGDLMNEPFRISVEASTGRKGVLDVHDALDQAADFFKILKGGNNKKVLFNIKTVARQNPLTMECVPHNATTLDIDYDIVEPNARAFHTLYRDISSGQTWNPDTPKVVRDATKRMLERNLNGIASTTCGLPHIGQSLEIKPESAKSSLRILALPPDPIYSCMYENRKRTELGSVEGTLMNIGTHDNRPSVKIWASNLKRSIWCQLAAAELQKWEKMSACVVWSEKRVSVQGKIFYKKDGNLEKVIDGYVEIVEESDVSLEDLFDPDFTGGLSAREYLDKLREGDYGGSAY